MLNITSQAHPSIGGAPMSEIDFVRWERDRARVALLLLKEKLRPAGVRDLLADEIAESDRRLTAWAARSGGRFVESSTDIAVDAGNVQDFLQWFQTAQRTGDDASLLGSMPEHYVMEGEDVVEVLGGYGLPALIRVEFTDDLTVLPDPAAVDPALPVRMAGFIVLQDGTRIGAVLHQFVNTDPGFIARLRIYFSAAVPDEMVRGHERHLACEFVNWTNSYLTSAGLRDS